ncbi:hypothetical protein BDF19DRAFT_455072 [Syncephalis fuscata]|nr:hypothetical protein BDF19DRAFT_455072 [Syncephalis fuscata]
MSLLRLPFQREIFTELLNEDGLLVLAKGLGVLPILVTLLQLPVERKTLVLLLNVSSVEEQELQLALAELTGGQTTIKVLKNDTMAEDRVAAYNQGGLLSVTSRILVVDMLKKRVPITLITGVIVVNAHKVTGHSLEAFILRLYRNENTNGFLKALSEVPEGFSGGFAPLESSLKALQLRKTLLWPRFHVDVKASLDTSAKVIELRQPMTERMKQIQSAIIDCLDACLGELRRAHIALDVEQLTVENALLKSFDVIIRRQLDPLWHQVSQKTKRLVYDMQILRQLLIYLISYDCVAFNAYLDTLLASQQPVSAGAFPQPPSPWMMMDAASVLFNASRERVYRHQDGALSITRRLAAISDTEPIPTGIDLVLEEQPKWALLRNTLMEIYETAEYKGPILVMVQDARTAQQLETYWVRQKAASVKTAAQDMLYTAAVGYFRWKQQLSKKLSSTTNGAATTLQSHADVRNLNRPGYKRQAQQPANKRRRVRGGGNSTGRSSIASPLSSGTAPMGTTSSATRSDELAIDDMPSVNLASMTDTALSLHDTVEDMNTMTSDVISTNTALTPSDVLDDTVTLTDDDHLLVIRPVTGSADAQLLKDLQPRHIILYDPIPVLVRQVEIYQALYPEKAASVYFMLYENSVEEQRYLSDIRREKLAFEKLIHENSKTTASEEEMFIKVLNSRQGGNNRRVVASEVAPQVVVDMREFRSTLPPILHEQGLDIIPCTLIVGDYVLSPDICVERKSIADLISSFQSGRLYTQVDAMCTYYETPAIQDIGSDISIQDITSKLALLSITFPKLRTIWSSSTYATADIFADLKKNHLEPNADEAAMMERELLQSLPGVTSANYRLLARKVGNLKELATLSQEAIADIIGENGARQLYRFIHSDSS